MQSKRLLVVCLMVIAVSAGWTDGGFHAHSDSIALSSDQRAILIKHRDEISMTFSTGYTGDGREFGWIIPTPVPPEIEDVFEAGTVAEDVFNELDRYSAPAVVTYTYHACFPADTLVHTAEGLQSIGTIEPGSNVHAYDFETDQWVLSRVVKQDSYQWQGDLITIRTTAGTIRATGNHPFFAVHGDALDSRSVPGGGINDELRQDRGRWVEARDLRPGDRLLDRHDSDVTVTAVSSRAQAAEVFHIEVERFHNYGVGHAGILVHNEAQKESASGGDAQSIVTVYGSATLEHYGVSVVGAGDAESLLDWLQSNEFQVDLAAKEVLDGYINHGWSFVAAKLNPSERRLYDNEMLPPLTIRYKNDHLIFPLRISSVSTVDQAKISLFVLSDSPMKAVNFLTTPLLYDRTIPEQADAQGYLESCIQGTIDLYSGRALAVVFCDTFDWSEYRYYDEGAVERGLNALLTSGNLNLEQLFLTRLEGRMGPEAMTSDILFEADRSPSGFSVEFFPQREYDPPSFGNTALYHAAYMNDMELMKAILTTRIDIDFNHLGARRALLSAVQKGDEEVGSLLISGGVDPNSVALVLAIDQAIALASGRPRRVLVEAGRDVSSLYARIEDRWPYVVVAADEGQEEIIQLLVEAGADVNVRTDTRQTALMRAARGGHLEIIRILLEAGADPNRRSRDGDTAQTLAQSEGYLEIVTVLREYGARR